MFGSFFRAMNEALIPYNNPRQQNVLSETSASSCGDVSTRFHAVPAYPHLLGQRSPVLLFDTDNRLSLPV
jgi:hypothetical protein